MNPTSTMAFANSAFSDHTIVLFGRRIRKRSFLAYQHDTGMQFLLFSPRLTHLRHPHHCNVKVIFPLCCTLRLELPIYTACCPAGMVHPAISTSQ